MTSERTTAAARLMRKTLKTSSRTAYRALRSREVDWDTRTAPSTSPPIRIGMAMNSVTAGSAPGVIRVEAP